MLGKIGGWRRRGRQRMRWFDGISWMDMSLSKLQELVMDREAWRAADGRVRHHSATELNQMEAVNSVALHSAIWCPSSAIAAFPQDSSVQFSSVAQSCLTLCDPVNHSTPGLPVYHQLPEFTQTHAHYVGDAIQPSHPLLSPSPPAPNPSQHQGLFQ